MKLSPSLILLATVLVSLPIAFIAITSLTSQVGNFFDPCMKWGLSAGGSVALIPGGPCSTGAQATSETVFGAALRLVLIHGGILLAAGLGILGVFRSRPTLVIVGSIILFGESVPLVFDGLFVITLLTAGFFLWTARRLSSDNECGIRFPGTIASQEAKIRSG